jgi:hypothetical protein
MGATPMAHPRTRFDRCLLTFRLWRLHRSPIDFVAVGDVPQVWAMCGRRPRCKGNLAIGLRSGASHVSGLFARRS